MTHYRHAVGFYDDDYRKYKTYHGEFFLQAESSITYT